MRLFVSLDVPREAIEHLDHVVAPLRQQHEELRWTPPTRWHLTLAFLGDVPERTAEQLGERLARAAARHAAMTLAFTGGGRFGSRVLWAGVTGDLEHLRALAQSVAAASRRAGVAIDKRTQRPHVTLARSRTTSADLRPLVAALGDYEGPTWRSAHVHLVRSHLGAEPRYDVLRSWPFAG